MGARDKLHVGGAMAEPVVVRPEISCGEDSRPSRRGLMRIGTASLTGLILTHLGSNHTEAQVALEAGLQQEPPFPSASVTMLPAPLPAELLQKVLLPDPRFKIFHDHFTGEGMRFITERVQVAMYTPRAAASGPFSISPALLAIVPSFRPFKATDPSHEAVSIVAVRSGDRVGGVVATHVTVGHRPWQLLSFSIVELDKENKLVTHRVDRADLERLSPAELAKKLGPPTSEMGRPGHGGGEPRIRSLPLMEEKDALTVVALVYRTFITDRFAGPLYPRDGLQSLLAETRLTQKWCSAQFQRVSAPLVCGTSTSTSCNGCTSTTTSCVPDPDRQ